MAPGLLGDRRNRGQSQAGPRELTTALRLRAGLPIHVFSFTNCVCLYRLVGPELMKLALVGALDSNEDYCKGSLQSDSRSTSIAIRRANPYGSGSSSVSYG